MMKSKFFLRPHLFVLILAFSGCFPLKTTRGYGASGTVIDSVTGHTISEATIRISDCAHYKQNSSTLEPSACTMTDAQGALRESFAVTNADGHFEIPNRREWVIYMFASDLFVRPSTLMVSKEGYQTNLVLTPNIMCQEICDFGKVALTPLAVEKLRRQTSGLKDRPSYAQ